MLVGREGLLAVGDIALAEARQGRGRLLLLAGEAGIGKTSLAQAVADRARVAGATVRIGACWETEGLPPFTPWLDALRRPGADACATVAGRLDAGAAAATDAASAARAQARLFAEVADALYAVSGTQPQVVLLEDLHWADGPSLELLTALSPHLPSMAVLVIATYRDDELARSSPLARLGGRAERLALGGLDADAVGELLEEVIGRPARPDEAAALQRRTGGNPLFVTQVARLLGVGSEGVPVGVQDVLERRLARVSSACAHVLGAAAVLGHEFDEAPLAAVVGGDVLTALDEARAARLVTPVDDAPMRWRFVHALVQATRYEALAAAERAAWHHAAVGALRGRAGITAATLAHHATRGRLDPADPEPATLLVAAGHEALARLAWTDAAAAFERALAAAPEGAAGDESRAEAWLGIGAARLRQDRADVRAAFDEASLIGRRLGRPDLVARAALGFGVGLGAFEVRLLDHRQIDLLEEASRTLDPGDPLLSLVLARLSVALAFVDSDERRAALATRAVDLARAAQEPVVLGHALAARCDALAGPEHIADRLAASAEIVALGQRASDLPLELLGRRLRVVALLESVELGEADVEIGTYAKAASALGDPLYAWFAPLWQATRAWNRGELDAAEQLVADAVAVGARGGSQNSALLGSVFRFVTALDRRDRARCEAAVQEMVTLVPIKLAAYFGLTTAFVEAHLGDLDRARAALQQVSRDDLDALPRDSEWVCWLVQVIATAARVEQTELAAHAYARLAPLAGSAAVEGIGAYVHGPVDRFLAVGAAVAGDADAVRRHVADATRIAAGGGALVEALTALDSAWALRRAGAPDDAEQAIGLARAAARTFRELGLAPLLEEADALAGAGPPVPTSAPVSALGPTTGTLARQGDTWACAWTGTTVHVRHAKGLADLAVLLERAGREVHVRELEGVPSGSTLAGTHQAALDETAVQQYRQRLADLEDDLDEADRHGDVGRAARLSAERDVLVEELTKAFGLGGRARRAGGDPDERLRKAVSARVRASIDRIEQLHPALGRHLRASVRTGFWCSYRPEPPVSWTVTR